MANDDMSMEIVEFSYQVGGHPGFQRTNRCTVLKPFQLERSDVAVQFFKHCPDILREFIPEFHGVKTVGDEMYLELEVMLPSQNVSKFKEISRRQEISEVCVKGLNDDIF